MSDVVIIGGGIVGLSTAYQLKKSSPNVNITLLEKEKELAAHQTGHNSGVIHSGIYYKPGSLKARNCVRGYDYMVNFCEQHHIEYDLCGKVIVATTDDQLPILDNILQRGLENGLKDIKMISAEEMKEIEPHVRGVKAIRVPYTGIVDYKNVCLKLGELLEKDGVEIRTGEKVSDIQIKGNKNIIETNKNSYQADLTINCAGLYSDKIAKMTGADVSIRIIPFRGEYFKLKDDAKHLVNHLIYPVPDPNFPFLGVHFTRMIDGAIEAGPNAVFAFRKEGYRKTDFHAGEFISSITYPGFIKVVAKYWQTGLGEMYRSWSKSAFVKALQELIPEIKSENLSPGPAGVRAQACDPKGGLIDDFVIYEHTGFINVCNAPSPAATSSLSIGETIAEKALKHLN